MRKHVTWGVKKKWSLWRFIEISFLYEQGLIFSGLNKLFNFPVFQFSFGTGTDIYVVHSCANNDTLANDLNVCLNSGFTGTVFPHRCLNVNTLPAQQVWCWRLNGKKCWSELKIVIIFIMGHVWIWLTEGQVWRWFSPGCVCQSFRKMKTYIGHKVII